MEGERGSTFAHMVWRCCDRERVPYGRMKRALSYEPGLIPLYRAVESNYRHLQPTLGASAFPRYYSYGDLAWNNWRPS